MKTMYNKTYFQGNSVHCGSDLIRKYDTHWWSFRFYSLLVKKYLKNGTVLDLGCAHGYIHYFLDPTKYKKVGVDISEYAISEARLNNPEGVYYISDVEKLVDIKDESIDLVISKYVLEHLSHPEMAIREVYRVLKKNGTLIFSVPNTTSKLRKNKGKNWIGDRDKTHLSVFSPTKWNELMNTNGFKNIKSFSDGFWDVPYIKIIPNFIQLIIFSLPSIIQTFLGLQIIPVKLGENLIVVSKKL